MSVVGDATIADLRRQLDEYRTERDAALAREAALAEVLEVINRSPDDPQPVFEAILEKARLLCGAEMGALQDWDGEYVRVLARYGYSEDIQAFLTPLWQRARPGLGQQPLFQGERFVHVLDTTKVEIRADEDAGTRNFIERSGTRTWLSVPLRRNDVLIGAIAVARSEVRAFADTDIVMLENLAAQAVIAMENARLLNEQREALERQTATAEVLGVINANPGNLAPVFDAILEKALRLCDSAFGVFSTYNGELFNVVAARGVPDDPDGFLRRPHMALPGLALTRVVQGEDVVQIADITDDEAYHQGIPDRRFIADVCGGRTQLLIALRKNKSLLGMFNIFRQEVRPFSDRQIELLRGFAAQAVIATENARLLDELRAQTEALAQRNSEYGERIEQQAATIDVLKAMSASSGDARPVFQVIVARARAFCNADNANLALVDGDVLHVQARTTENADYMAQFPRRVDGTSLFGRAILASDAVQTPDVRADPQHFTHATAGRITVRALVAVPLLRSGTPIGAIVLARNTPGEFSATQVELLRTFADQAVIAISSAEIFRELQRRTAELTRSVAELQALEEVLRAVNSSLDLDTVLSTIISRAVQLSDADQGTIYEFDRTEQVFVPKAAFGMTAEGVEALRGRRIRMGETPLGISAANRAPLHIPDLTQRLDIDGSRELLASGMHALLAVPLLWKDAVVGGLVIRRRAVGGFAPSIPTLLQTFAGQCVLAIENARLFQDASQARTSAETALADLRRAQVRLVQAEKMASLGQLTAGIAHEIKNPLNFVNNFADLSADLLDELHDAIIGKAQQDISELTATLKGNLARIAEHGRRADSIVKNMLLHSRSGPGEHRRVDLNAIIEEALNLAYHGARAETPGFNITMQKQLDPTIGMVEMFPQEITRVMLNLIGNGFYAARRRAAGNGVEPTLWLTTRNLGEHVEIRVRDNGTGIDQAVRDRVFEPFFTTKPAGEGTGLGLSISYDIVVKQHGGQLTVESEPGVFTEFTLMLPCAMAEGAPA